ncbi:hypothetical protein [Pseudomonas putida]|nr:hypothetical protein [Pseudomonas putida]
MATNNPAERAIEPALVGETEECGVEHGDFDIQLDQSGEAVDGFSNVYG